jgi:hypothetical protein
MLNWTASYGQVGRGLLIENQDTLNCYTNSEMVRIVRRVVRANECDTLLKISEQQIAFLDTVITYKDSVIASQDSIVNYKESIIIGKEEEITSLRSALKKIKTREKWLKIGWAGTTVGLGAAIIRFLIRK